MSYSRFAGKIVDFDGTDAIVHIGDADHHFRIPIQKLPGQIMHNDDLIFKVLTPSAADDEYENIARAALNQLIN